MLRSLLKYIYPIFTCELTSTLWSLLEIRELIMSAGVWLTRKIGLGWVNEELDVELDLQIYTSPFYIKVCVLHYAAWIICMVGPKVKLWK